MTSSSSAQNRPPMVRRLIRKVRAAYRRWNRIRPLDPDAGRVARYLAACDTGHRPMAP